MAIRRNENGTYTVTSKKQAVEAIEAMTALQESIDELLQEHGITEMMEDATELKKAATNYCVSKKVETLPLSAGHATLITASYDRRVVATQAEADLINESSVDRKIVPLRKILAKKFRDKKQLKEIWNRVTVRVVNVPALEEVVQEGILDVDEISPAYHEKQKAPYLRIFKDA